jgi:transposase
VLTIDRFLLYLQNFKIYLMNVNCKYCGSTECTKNGRVRDKQRYKCKSCGNNFVVGDKREKVRPEGKALAVLLYSTGKSSYGFISKLFHVSRPGVLKWIRKVAQRLPEPPIDSSIKEVQFDEMWHFINKKNKSYGCGEPWIVVETKPSDGLLAIVLIKPLRNSMKNSSI